VKDDWEDRSSESQGEAQLGKVVTVGGLGHAGGKHRIYRCVHVCLDVTPCADGAASLFLASLLDRESVDTKREPGCEDGGRL
jgi:hypothetical protein